MNWVLKFSLCVANNRSMIVLKLCWMLSASVGVGLRNFWGWENVNSFHVSSGVGEANYETHTVFPYTLKASTLYGNILFSMVTV